ncbi:MAG: hypothetical protein KGO96_13130 [Elusimicrobia bacterium]|nr:hypothetical protein [Elusimicrobiota bacterium]MDE2426837.1 hypothetical protein [Elusimicrobiota bacterium]
MIISALIISLLLFPGVVSQHSMVTVTGTSHTDAWDRVVSLTYRGIEVARFITPDRTQIVNGSQACVPQGGLCNWFNLTAALPFTPDPALLSISTGYLGGTWSFSESVQTWGRSQVASIIPEERILSGAKVNFTIPYGGEVYFLISGHNQCETGNPSKYYVDGFNGTVLNWSYGQPFTDKTRFTTGVVIPYVSVYLSAGEHTLTATCTAVGVPYFLVSAFEVNPFGEWGFA